MMALPRTIDVHTDYTVTRKIYETYTDISMLFARVTKGKKKEGNIFCSCVAPNHRTN